MSKLYIYALATEVFPDEQAYFDSSPETEYFYVGRTEDLERRKAQHVGEARRGSSYPYHQRIRDLGEAWYLEKLECVDKDLVSDHEEYHMIVLTCEGHPLLNIKRGDRIKRESEAIVERFNKNNIRSSTDYSNAMRVAREEKIKLREFNQIKSQIKHLRYDAQTEIHYYEFNGEIHKTEKYVSKNELVNSLCPSINKKLQELMKSVESFRKGSE